VDNVATSFYLRGLAQNVTMVGFLGEWLWLLGFQSALTCADKDRLADDPSLWAQLALVASSPITSIPGD
jgi:hypothetical protein